jgi:hypothetical protein
MERINDDIMETSEMVLPNVGVGASIPVSTQDVTDIVLDIVDQRLGAPLQQTITSSSASSASSVSASVVVDGDIEVATPQTSTLSLSPIETSHKKMDVSENTTSMGTSADDANTITIVNPATGTSTSTSTITNTGAASTGSALDNARVEVKQMMERNELEMNSISAIQTLFRDYETMKEKVTKLKTLLGRSAKAQRDTKVEMDMMHKKYETIQKENKKLLHKIEQLSTRPTHMDLLVDFETNFDRALLSVSGKQQQQQQQQQQSVGQDTSGTMASFESALGDPMKSFNNNNNNNSSTGTTSVVDNLLMQELSESKQRIEKLEQLNTSLVHRSGQLESQYNQAKRTIDELMNKISHLELEKRMAQMEAEQAHRQMQQNQSSLQEMQMEIELISQSAHKAAIRAATEKDRNKSMQSDFVTIQQLQEQMKALEEWAMASNQAKTLANDRIRLLEGQVRGYQAQLHHHQHATSTGATSDMAIPGSIAVSTDSSTITPVANENATNEFVLDTRKASLVIGAGDVGVCVFELDTDLLKSSVNTFTQRIVLRYTFDLLPNDTDIVFSLYKGSCQTKSQRRNADTYIKDRMVKSGAGGEVDDAFSIGRACTLIWSNEHSWIRPRTVKYTIDAIVVDD